MKKLIFILLILTFLTSPVSADTIEPLFGFGTPVDFPSDIKSGATYQSEHVFSSTQDAVIIVKFTISHPDINYNEWDAHFVLNDINMSLNESTPGHFVSSVISISKGNYLLNISFSSLPNIVPGQYNYTFDLLSTQVEKVSYSRRSSSRHASWIITTPTPTPEPVSATTTTPLSEIVQTPTSAPVINITSTQTYLTTDYRPHIILGSMILLLTAIIAMIFYGRIKKQKKILEASKSED